jgi:hypothetical protein
MAWNYENNDAGAEILGRHDGFLGKSLSAGLPKFTANAHPCVVG